MRLVKPAVIATLFLLVGVVFFITDKLTADDSAKLSSHASTDSPVFRGIHGDGIVRGDKSNLKWSAKGPKEAWKKEIGIGFCGFSVVGNKVLTMGHIEGNDTVWCFDIETGDELWKYAYECKLVDNLHEGGPAATPTIDGNSVYTFSKEGHLHCFDLATGEVKWKKELAKELKVEMPQWGYACSPRVYKDNLIIDSGMTVAVNKNNGEIVWKTQEFQPGYGSSTFFEFEKKPVAAILNNNALIVVNLEDGTELASTPWETDYVTSSGTPVVQGNQIYISTGYKKGCALFEFTGTELKEVYKNKVIRSHMQTPVLIDGYLYGVDGQSNESSRCKLVCQEFATGKMIWEKTGAGCGSVIAADKTLIILSDKGLLATAEVNPKEFTAISEPAQIVKGKCWTAPVLANGRIFVRTAKGQAVCLDVRKK